MTIQDGINFELMIMDMIEREGIKDAKELQDFSEELHEHIENAICDYTMDNSIEDYTPFF